jgi:2-polyprenyl-3-methyl-5-hydroxy-6-metoxy-1,4-benzoquinol methylase
MKCRFCKAELSKLLIDLVNSPPSNSLLIEAELNYPEIYYPLKIFICHNCFLVQIDEYKQSNEIFNEKYVYYSSYSSTWLNHAKNYVNIAKNRFKLNGNSFVIEIASNDGYLLQYVKEQGIPCLGIEPAANVAAVAKQKGIPVVEKFFGTDLARNLVDEGKIPDLIIGNNVLAHVPNLNDFIQGLKILLHPKGVISLEFPHLLKLIENNQFDTIYHEHYSYFSFFTANNIFKHHGLEIFDVEELPTHGGSLRIYLKHAEDKSKNILPSVENLINLEMSKKINDIDYYKEFQNKVNDIKYDLLNFLITQKKNNNVVIAYGAAAKGNTLLNYCGIKKDLIQFVVDISPNKQNKFLPGSHIPILHENEIKIIKPRYILILAWNIKEEIMQQLNYVREWGCKFVIPIPKVMIV